MKYGKSKKGMKGSSERKAVTPNDKVSLSKLTKPSKATPSKPTFKY